jgi:DNA-binding protein H-NS
LTDTGYKRQLTKIVLTDLSPEKISNICTSSLNIHYNRSPNSDLRKNFMANYTELMAQAQALMAQAEQARKVELTDVVAGIKSQMKQYGITTADLGGTSGAKSPKSKLSAPAKFRGPNGELWAGGPGRKPEWVRTALTAGKNIEEFRI